MLVCSCRAVNERTVQAAASAGATSTHDLGRMTGAGTRCGGCLPTLEALLREIDERAPDTRAATANTAA